MKGTIKPLEPTPPGQAHPPAAALVAAMKAIKGAK